MERPKLYTLAVDFDGVLHRYDSPWVNPHTIPDEPVPGAIDWLRDMSLDFDIVIHSTRAQTWRGRRAMRRWLVKHGYNQSVKFWYKPKAIAYVDDRGWRFTGGPWPTARDFRKMRPWNKVR